MTGRAEGNALLAELHALGGWEGVAEISGEALADYLLSLAIAWWRKPAHRQRLEALFRCAAPGAWRPAEDWNTRRDDAPRRP